MTRSVLLVNDEPCSRYLMRLLLENLGLHVHEASYGLDALQTARENRPDFLIFDVEQKAGSGLAIFKPADKSGTAVVSIALLTAKTQWSVFSKLLQGTITQYLPKPITGIELGHIFQDMLKSSEALSI